MKTYLAGLILLLLSGTIPLSANTSVDSIRTLADNIAGTALVSSLEHVIGLLEDGKKEEAGAAMLAILDTPDPQAQAELTAPSDAYGPLALRVRAAGIQMIGEATKWYDDRILPECLAILADYREDAAGKQWTEYLRPHLFLAWVYQNGKVGKFVEAATILEEAMDYAPDSPWPLGDYINLCVVRHSRIGSRQAHERLAAYTGSGGVMSDWLAYNKLRLSSLEHTNVFSHAVDFLRDYPDADPKWLINALDIARTSIDPDQPEQIREFYTTLTSLALKQSGDEQHIGIVAHILNEKEKLEAIMPELKN